MMSLWDALRMNMMISYQELVRTFPSVNGINLIKPFLIALTWGCLPILTAKGRSTFSSESITLLIINTL